MLEKVLIRGYVKYLVRKLLSFLCWTHWEGNPASGKQSVGIV